MHRLFGLLALIAGALGVWAFLSGPVFDPPGGGDRSRLPDVPSIFRAWVVGVLMGMALAWLANPDWRKVRSWMRLQRRRLSVLILAGLLASLLLLF
jgi:hypothetical protein